MDNKKNVPNDHFSPEEQARRRAIIREMLADRDRRPQVSIDDMLKWREESRPKT